MQLADFVGIPFVEHGRDLEGIDCWGLIWLYHKEMLGHEVPSYHEDYVTAYDKKEIATLIKKGLPDWCQVFGTPQPGDVVLLNIKKLPCHVGVVVEPGKMLHVMRGTETAIESYNGLVWRRRVLGVFRHKDFYK